jgi:hypothetical protein
MAAYAARANADAGPEPRFSDYRVPRDGRTMEAEPTKLQLVMSPGDDGEPVLSDLLPQEERCRRRYRHLRPRHFGKSGAFHSARRCQPPRRAHCLPHRADCYIVIIAGMPRLPVRSRSDQLSTESTGPARHGMASPDTRDAKGGTAPGAVPVDP